MGGLIVASFALAIVCIVLIVQKFRLHHRIRKLTEQVDGFNSGTAEMLDVALREDSWPSCTMVLRILSWRWYGPDNSTLRNATGQAN